jgi:hypothetical protein
MVGLEHGQQTVHKAKAELIEESCDIIWDAWICHLLGGFIEYRYGIKDPIVV